MIAIAVDAILVLVVLEGIVLTMVFATTGRGVPPATLWPNLAAGFLLALAVRVAIGNGAVALAPQGAIAAVLGCALVAHLLDLRSRWNRRSTSPSIVAPPDGASGG